ncbi:MAG: YbfB/YjiJ family MFS transporter [Burkholderiales bacterium]
MQNNRSAAAWRTALTGFLTLAVAVGIGRFAYTPLLPLMLHDAGLTIVAGSWLASANYLGYIAGALSAARLPGPPARWIAASLVGTAALTAAMGFTQSTSVWLVLRTLAGIASAWGLVLVSAWAMQRLMLAGAAQRSGVVFAGVGLGMAFTGVLAALGRNLGASSAALWIAFGALAVAITVGVWPLLFAPAPAAPSRQAAAPTARPPRRAVVVLVATYGIFGFGYIIPATFLPVIARDALGTAAVTDWFWPALGLAAAASTLAASRLTERHGNTAILAWSFLLEGIGIALLAAFPGVAGFALSALLVGGTFMVITMATIRAAQELAGTAAGGLIAGLTAAFGIGQIAGPLFAGYVVHTSGGFAWALAVAAGAMILAGMVIPRGLRAATRAI